MLLAPGSRTQDHLLSDRWRRCSWADSIPEMWDGRWVRWPQIWRMVLTACDVQEVFERSGDGKSQEKVGEVKKVRFLDRLKALEMFARLKEIDRFVSNRSDVNVSVNTSVLEQRLLAGRARVAAAQDALPAQDQE